MKTDTDSIVKTKEEETNNMLPIMEHFLTLQGEGYHAGKLAYFIRLGGCDVGCHWCDVKESWDASQYKSQNANQIIEWINQTNAKIVVITGGEPLTYNLNAFTQEIKTHNKKLHLETSGVYPLTGYWDWICFSPKKFKKPKQEFFECANELKVIIYNKSDLLWAKELASQMNEKAKLFVQPEWSKRENNLVSIVEFIKDNPKWRISLQQHKYIHIN